jgi:hypothetical protein
MRSLTAVAAALVLAATPATARQGLPVDVARLTPHRDSLAVFVGGEPRGASVLQLQKRGDTLAVTELTSIGTVMRQETTVDLDAAGRVQRVHQSGVIRDAQASIDIRYVAGHVTGQVQAVTADGPKQVAIDTTVPPGTVDDNSLQALLPALPWAEGASWSFTMFSAGSGMLTEMQLTVMAVETVMVPAGAFEAYRANLTGGTSDVSFLVMKKAPHTVLKVETVGAPIKFELVSSSTP